MTPATQLNFHLLTALGLSHDSAEIVMDRISELEAQNRALCETLAELTNGTRVILPKTEAHARAMYQIAFSVIGDFAANPTHHPMSSVDCRP